MGYNNSKQEEMDREGRSRSERIQMAKDSFHNGGKITRKKTEEEIYGVDIFLKSAKSFCLRSVFALVLFAIVYGIKKYDRNPLGIEASDIKEAIESREEQEELEVFIRTLF